jgi:hypothetical protein
MWYVYNTSYYLLNYIQINNYVFIGFRLKSVNLQIVGIINISFCKTKLYDYNVGNFRDRYVFLLQNQNI